jgi:protein phosphatase
MIRDSELLDVLSSAREPMDACRELTSRANAAGGHDNITVLVIKFGGEGLREPSADDPPLVFRRYTLSPTSLSDTTRAARAPGLDAAPASVSEEAKNETRELRVSHTMVGTSLPEPAPMPAPATAGTLQSSHPPPGPRSVPSTLPPGRRSEADEVLHLPTSGLAPQWVFAIVVLALLVIALVGLFLLR